MRTNLAYRVIRSVGKPLLRIAFRLTAEGVELVPGEGGLIVAANHVSYLDPLVLGAVFPRPVRFLMLRSFYEPWYLRWFCAPVGAIPIDTEGGMQLGSIKRALRALEEGEVVGIFPEGARSRDGSLQPFERGVALLAARAGVPVVPAFIDGTHRAMPPGSALIRPRKIRVVLGEPLAPQTGKDGSAEAALHLRVERAVAALARKTA
jgi:1-acyl-sn-glycerol-3-phosphate acyltransferase